MRITAVLLLLVAVMLPTTTYSQPVPPAPGVEMPQAYFDRIAEDKTAFQFQKAWIQKAERAKEARQRMFADARARGMDFASFPESVREAAMVAGTTEVPVMMGKYSNTGADPYPVAALQANRWVEYAEPDSVMYIDAFPVDPPDDNNYSSQWGLHNTGQSGGTVDADIDAPEAWQTQLGDPDNIVVVIDTGVN